MMIDNENVLLLDGNHLDHIHPHYHIDRSWVFGTKADFAKELINHSVCNLHDIDSTKLVTKCCDIADQTFREFERRGWLHQVPGYRKALEKLREDGTNTPGYR